MLYFTYFSYCPSSIFFSLYILPLLLLFSLPHTSSKHSIFPNFIYSSSFTLISPSPPSHISSTLISPHPLISLHFTNFPCDSFPEFFFPNFLLSLISSLSPTSTTFSYFSYLLLLATSPLASLTSPRTIFSHITYFFFSPPFISPQFIYFPYFHSRHCPSFRFTSPTFSTSPFEFSSHSIYFLYFPFSYYPTFPLDSLFFPTFSTFPHSL